MVFRKSKNFKTGEVAEHDNYADGWRVARFTKTRVFENLVVYEDSGAWVNRSSEGKTPQQ